jgi:hypothetical protein
MRTDAQTPQLTQHAEVRLGQRRIPPSALAAVLAYGRRSFVRGAQVRAIGRNEVQRYQAKGIDLRPYEGLQVLLAADGSQVLTAYRNHDFRALKAAW